MKEPTIEELITDRIDDMKERLDIFVALRKEQRLHLRTAKRNKVDAPILAITEDLIASSDRTINYIKADLKETRQDLKEYLKDE